MDELMMDLLYDELDPARSAKVAEHMGACARCSAEMGALRRTRAAFRDLSDLEPPPSVSAILLHEAARHSPARAVVPAPSPGLLDRLRAWFRPIANHPALAAAASLVIVAGVAGALFVRKGADMAATRTYSAESASGSASPAPAEPASPPVAADPARSTPEPEPARIAAQPEGTAKDGDGMVAGVVDGKQQNQLELAQGADDRFAAEAEDAIEVVPADKELKEFDSDAPGTIDSVGRARDSNRGDQREKRKLSKREEQAAQTRLRSAPAAGGEVSPDQQTTGAPPATNAVSGAGPLEEPDAPKAGAGLSRGAQSATPKAPEPSTDSAKTTRSADEERLSSSERGWLDSRQVKVSELARKKLCPQAAALANDILERNPGYYARRVEGLKELVPCRSYVGVEQKRRAARRVQKPASKNSSAPQKARAAPARDEAAERSTE